MGDAAVTTSGIFSANHYPRIYALLWELSPNQNTHATVKLHGIHRFNLFVYQLPGSDPICSGCLSPFSLQGNKTVRTQLYIVLSESTVVTPETWIDVTLSYFK